MSNPHLQERLKYAKEQLEIGNYGRVTRAANELIDSNDPEFLKDGLLYKGMSLSFQGNTSEAIDYFNQAIDTFPDFQFAYFYRLESLVNRRQLEEAKADAAKLIELDETNVLYYEKLAAIELELGNMDVIEEICEKVLSMEPDNTTFTSILANLHFDEKKFQSAIDHYKKIEASEDFERIDQAPIYRRIGFGYLKLEDYTPAKSYLDKGLELNPNDPLAIAYLGYALTHLDEVDKGVDLINDSIDMAPNNSYAYLLLAKVAIVLNETEDAIECLDLAQEHDTLEKLGEEIEELRKVIKV